MRAIFLTTLLCVWIPCVTHASPKEKFLYNPKTGACENTKKQKGYNTVDVKKLFGVSFAEAESIHFRPKRQYKDGDAECADLRKFNFNTILKWRSATLVNWNFRGALLDNAKFLFAHMSKVDLRGAQLAELEFGYTIIDGQIDRFTKHPKEHCKVEPLKDSSVHRLFCRK